MAAGTATAPDCSLGVLGASEIGDRFRRTLERGRLASTYLFVGPEGVGKRLFALRLASVLLCDSAGGLRACGVCDSCRLMRAGTHPDLLQVSKPEGRSTLPLELFLGKPEARLRSGLCHDLGLRPLVSSRRVAIIDDADHFSVESANCLLKTLEEPPPRSVLFLVGTSLARQLPTIRSRSQVVRFASLEEQDVATILNAEPHGMNPEEAAPLAARSCGSVSRALELADGGLSEATEALMGFFSGSTFDPARFAKELEDLVKQAGSEAPLRRARMRDLLGAMIDHHRGLLRSGESLADSDRQLAALEVLLDAEQALQRNVNQSTLVQWIAASLSRLG